MEVHLGATKGWRTQAKLAVRAGPEGLEIGLFVPGTHEVCNIDGCVAHHPAINRAVNKLRRACLALGVRGYEESTGKGDLRYVKLDVERSSKSVQLTLVWHADDEECAGATLKNLVSRLKDMPIWHSIWVNFNPAGPSMSRIFAFEAEAWKRVG